MGSSKQTNSGFTIVELLIAVVVLAVLAAISMVAYNGVQSRALNTRAIEELTQIGKAIQIYQIIEDRYPADVDRNIPGEITPYLNGSEDKWPKGPWPGSVYDYDLFTGFDGNPASQISLRFCPIDGPISACNFPKEHWAEGFGVDSSMYYCVTGMCKSHPEQNDDYPGYCINCKP